LNNVTLPYTLALAAKGAVAAAQADPGLLDGFNTFRGHITSEPVAHSLDRAFRSVSDLL
jgi:alanine dehydrogenase